ncbi:MAG: hypothetical protein RLZZ70_181 [Candidatus Parcubacteria bacterium]|jgi:uncharacterized membrane protein YsdA (DUF1294 family)
MLTLEIIGIFLLVCNLIALVLMAYDKRQSTLSAAAPRISEGALFCMAICCGSAGILLGMYLFRHKIRKWYFQVAIPLLLLQQSLLTYWLLSTPL